MKDVKLNILINSLKAQVNVSEAKIKDIQKLLNLKSLQTFMGFLLNSAKLQRMKLRLLSLN